MIRAIFICLMFLGALLVLPSPGTAEQNTQPLPVPSLSAAPEGRLPTGALQDLLDKAVAQGIPGAVMGVATPEGSWFTAAGVADADTQEKMTPRHAMRIANATETFTAALIWSLIEEGRLGLNDKVNRRLPSGLVPRGGVVTIGMLLNHTSGLYDHTESSEFAQMMLSNPKHRWSAEEVLEITRSHPLKFVPGTCFAYSSTDDYILGLIAQAATGRSVEKMVRDRFFTPRGMARTALSQSGSLPRLNTPGYAWLDDRNQPTGVGRWNFSGYWTAGGGTSTAYDMLAWASGLAGGTVLKPKTLRQAWTVESPSMMGYGFEVTRNALGYRRIGRTGVKPGATTDLLVYPDQGYVLFIGFNISDSRSAPTLSTLKIIREVREAAELLLGWNVENSYVKTIAGGRSIIRQMLSNKDLNLPSASVALMDGERVVWSETFGYIDKAKKIRPDSDTMFCIGSVSKIFAAMATMKLVDQGKIDLDAPLARYLPEFRMLSPEYSQITVRMLLNHSAGFGGADYRNMFTYVPLTGYAAQVEEALASQRLKHAPGYLSVYCNDCVTMIEPLIEAVSGGKPYTQFVQEKILTPLGMENSRFSLEPFPAGSYAPGYKGKKPDSQEFAQPYASGGLYTTPEDMGRVAGMLMNGGKSGGVRILSEHAVAEMGRDQTRQLTFNPVPTFLRGLGWDNVAHSGLAAVGVRAWHKKGGTMVYETDFIVAPDEGLAVMVTFSGRSLLAGWPAEQIMLHALVERGRIPNVPQALPNVPQPEKPATDANLDAMVGDYASKSGPVRVEIQSRERRTLKILSGYDFAARTWSGAATGLKRRTDGTFSSDAAPNVSYRTLVADGRRYLTKNEPKWSGYYREDSPYAQLIKPATPLSAAWKKRVGRNWLAVNEVAESFLLAGGASPLFRLDVLSGLPGYLFATSPYETSQIVDPSGSDTMARMFLKIPMELGRDLNDVVIETRNGEEWVRCGSTLYRPQASVPALPQGVSTVAVGAEGFAEWRRLPATGSVTILGSSAWKLYDGGIELQRSGTGSGSVNVETAGSYLMLYGKPNTVILLTVAAS